MNILGQLIPHSSLCWSSHTQTLQEIRSTKSGKSFLSCHDISQANNLNNIGLGQPWVSVALFILESYLLIENSGNFIYGLLQ